MKSERSDAYRAAGVDIPSADRAKRLIKHLARATFTPRVLSEIGLFGSLYQLEGYRQPVLVASADGVGTKLKVATLLDRHDTVGIDLVNHCVNDILTCGATPLFFLDYIAMGRLVPGKVASIVSGLAQACRAVGCALIGGETAEMPGMYQGDDYDLVGFIVGAVEKSDIIDGRAIVAGDIVLGLPSSGLHTNGYSLVRKVFNIADDPAPLRRYYPELARTLGEELLEPHRCYYHELKPVLHLVKGLAHITGGGFEGNIPRVLPPGLAVEIDRNAWEVPPIFRLVQRLGKVSDAEMYRVFNMGIGMVVICSPEQATELLKCLPQAKKIGKVIPAKGRKRLSFS